MRIIVDCDDTALWTLKALCERYNADYNDNITPDVFDEWAMAPKVKPECGEKIYNYFLLPELYADVEPMPGAVQAIDKLREMDHEVLFATANTNPAILPCLRRHGLLLEHYSSIGYAQIYNKDWLKADLIVDDKPETVMNFPGLGILFDRKHNQSFNWMWRAHNWNEVIELVSKYQPCDDEPVELPPLHPTEQKCPEQAAAFREIIEKMYAVHLSKNQDYSPANVLGAGEVGLMTRTWDKVSRLMNLTGFKIDVSLKSFEPPCRPKNESVDDNLMDLAVYSIIWQIYRQGKWGK
jgi:5'-nucleotidase